MYIYHKTIQAYIIIIQTKSAMLGIKTFAIIKASGPFSSTKEYIKLPIVCRNSST